MDARLRWAGVYNKVIFVVLDVSSLPLQISQTFMVVFLH